MDATAVAERRAGQERANEQRSRAAAACRDSLEKIRLAEEACATTVTLLADFTGRPFGDRNERFRLHVARCRPVVGFVRHDLRRWLERIGVSPETANEVTLACSEGCANAVEHAHETTRQLVEVEAVLDDAELELRIRDYGVWSEGTGSQLRGRGLDMIRVLMDSLDVRRTPKGTELVMRKALTL